MIDFVFPYVDCSENVWFKSYSDTRRKLDLPTTINEVRFRGWDNLKYIFRGIERYMPYVRNVYMIVSNIEQVPSWIDQNKVKIVLHKDIIPEEFLPTFNSTCIEMFLNKIPDLSENFVYSNDDLFIMEPLEENELFINDKIRVTFKTENGSNTMFKKVEKGCLKLVTGKEPEDPFLKVQHTICPMKKSILDTVCEKYKDEIYNSCTPFRTEKNYNQYIYTYYAYYNDMTVNSDRTYKYFAIKPEKLEKILEEIEIPTGQTLCLNDTITLDPFTFNKVKTSINTALEQRFPNKSKYEKIEEGDKPVLSIKSNMSLDDTTKEKIEAMLGNMNFTVDKIS